MSDVTINEEIAPQQVDVAPTENQGPGGLPSDGGEAKKFAGKYDSPDALEEGYKSLNSEYTKTLEKLRQYEKSGGQQDPSEGDTESTEQIPADQEQAAQALEDVGLDFDDFTAEYTEKGELGEESYQKLEKAGIPKNMVDSFIQGQVALAKQFQADIQNVVGGEQNYTSMTQWASQNLTENEIHAFNAALEGSTEQAKLAVQGLYAQFSKNNSNPPNRMINSDATGNAQGGTYDSWAQVTADMRDSRYEKDSAYRKMVTDKLGRSNL